MKYYLDDSKNEIYAYPSDGSQDDLINADFKQITALRADEIRNPPLTLSDLKTAKKAEISANFEQTIQQITAGYPPNEIASWSKQEQEARAFTAVALAPTPLIDALANTRGVPKDTLAARIIAKADLFAGISGQLIGKRQGLEDSIEAATSKTALAAIAW